MIGSAVDPPVEPPIPESADALTAALSYLRMEGIFYCLSELTAPWSLRLPPMTDCVWFHVVMAGHFLLLDSSGATRPVGPGDLIVRSSTSKRGRARPSDTSRRSWR